MVHPEIPLTPVSLHATDTLLAADFRPLLDTTCTIGPLEHRDGPGSENMLDSQS